MAAVLVTQKTDALVAIVLVRAAITLFQIYLANGGLKRHLHGVAPLSLPPGTSNIEYELGFSWRMIRLGSEVYLMPSKR